MALDQCYQCFQRCQWSCAHKRWAWAGRGKAANGILAAGLVGSQGAMGLHVPKIPTLLMKSAHRYKGHRNRLKKNPTT